jgi:cell wall-associated NlpC family hydrolase
MSWVVGVLLMVLAIAMMESGARGKASTFLDALVGKSPSATPSSATTSGTAIDAALLSLSGQSASSGASTPSATTIGAQGSSSTPVVQDALSQLGVPYQWGAEAQGVAFDCSGLVQWAFGQVGSLLPRTSQQQYAATTPVSAAQLQPGDLVFSAPGEGGVSGPGHVGIYAGGGQYVDAPYTGQSVRLDPLPTGSDLVGYGRVPSPVFA